MSAAATAALQLVDELNALPDWEDRYAQIIAQGRALPAYPEKHRTASTLVKGCQAQVWLHPTWNGTTIHFDADSDALIVKGLVALLMRVYNDRTPAEILATEPTFLEQAHLAQHLSPNRVNGLAAMIKQIKLYAVAYAALATRAGS
jgi:cysteine desulfuration protein SufE